MTKAKVDGYFGALSDFEPMETDIENANILTKQPLHFTRSFTDTERQNLFNGLVINGFIPKDTNIDNCNFVFGGIETADFKPLQWQRQAGLLAYFIDNAFADTDSTNLWKITENCFSIKGIKPNINSLKNVVSKYNNDNKDKPKNHKEIDNILKNL